MAGLLDLIAERQKTLSAARPNSIAGLLAESGARPGENLASMAQQYISTLPQQTRANLEYQMGLLGKSFPGNTYESMMTQGDPKAMAELAMQVPITGIVSPKVVNKLKMPTTLPSDDIFTQAVANTPSARISEEGLHLNVMRNQKPQQAGTESVRGGVFYLPEGSTSIKHYGGSSLYGGTEKISGETLYKNPLVVKGATGGKAPEAAYDQLMGKGAYQEMRNDALRVRLDPRIKDSIMPDEFLAKYAPDLEGYGDYIYNNSREGNQLAYALQEAAVAQKARDAGYDAVIGYSKKKSGDPYLSEIFDVREAIYPSKQGDYRLMDKFEGLLSE